MNLQEHIRKVLREEKRLSPFINRRSPEDEINAYFNKVKNRLITMIISDKSSMMDKDEFKQFIITYTINFIMENYYDTFPEMTDFYEKLFDELYEYYNNEMDESYESINNINLQEQISRIQPMMGVINESDKRKYWLLRRLETPDVKDYIEDNISYLTVRGGCGYKRLNDPFRGIMEDLVSNLVNFFSDELYDEEDQLDMDMFVWALLEEKYGDLIKKGLDNIDCPNN